MTPHTCHTTKMPSGCANETTTCSNSLEVETTIPHVKGCSSATQAISLTMLQRLLYYIVHYVNGTTHQQCSHSLLGAKTASPLACEYTPVSNREYVLVCMYVSSRVLLKMLFSSSMHWQASMTGQPSDSDRRGNDACTLQSRVSLAQQVAVSGGMQAAVG